MARGNYQYGTSPRKVEPDYFPDRKRSREIKQKQEEKLKKSKQKRMEMKMRKKNYRKKIGIILLVFAVLLAISYRNSLITERFNEIQGQKSELAALDKQNSQLEVSIEESVSLNNVEKEAKDKLGMQKLDNNQKVYVNLDKKDYTESAKEDVKIDDNSNWFSNFINNIFK